MQPTTEFLRHLPQGCAWCYRLVIGVAETSLLYDVSGLTARRLPLCYNLGGMASEMRNLLECIDTIRAAEDDDLAHRAHLALSDLLSIYHREPDLN
jgi:hypothetical protein